MITIEYNPVAGTDIGAACRTSCVLADDNHVEVSMRFNGVTVVVSPGDNAANDVKKRYDEACKAAQLKWAASWPTKGT